MSRTHKTILRIALIVSFIIINALVIFGISALLTYLNTGADRHKMLHTEIKNRDQYLPKVIWDPILNEGRPMDTETLKTIEKDYLNALFVTHIAYSSNLIYGIDDYYTESARKNLIDIINLNKEQAVTISSTTLEHQLNLEFFSEDGQLVVLTDRNALEYKSVYKDDKLVRESNASNTSKVVLLLEDGFWRIRHIVREKSTPIVLSDPGVVKMDSTALIKGINYYPQSSPWNMFGDDFDMEVIRNDFKIIKDSKLNTIRIFIPYADFGKAKVSKPKLEKLESILDAAEMCDLKVIVTLFDFYGDYSVLDWTLNHRHAETIVDAFKDHNSILAWDLKNEPDLDFKSRGKENVLAWLRQLIVLIRSIDPNHAITIGWSNSQHAALLSEYLDLVSFHYYDDISDLEESYKQLQRDIPNKPLLLGEFGMSSYRGFWNPFGNSQKEQAQYHKDMQALIKRNNISNLSWTLYDFEYIPNSVSGWRPWRKNMQKRYGFIDKRNKPKPAFRFISRD